MKRSVSSILKLSGKPINAVKEKKHLTYDEMITRIETLRLLRNSSYSSLPPIGVSRSSGIFLLCKKGFIRSMPKLHRWAIASRVALVNTRDHDCDSDKPSYYSGMRKGVPIFNNNRIRIYMTHDGAERAIKRIVNTGLLLEHQLRLVHI